MKNRRAALLFIAISLMFYLSLEYFFPMTGLGVIIARPLVLISSLILAFIIYKRSKKVITFLTCLLVNVILIFVSFPQDGGDILSEVQLYFNRYSLYNEVTDLEAFKERKEFSLIKKHITIHKYYPLMKGNVICEIPIPSHTTHKTEKSTCIIIDTTSNKVYVEEHTTFTRAYKNISQEGEVIITLSTDDQNIPDINMRIINSFSRQLVVFDSEGNRYSGAIIRDYVSYPHTPFYGIIIKGLPRMDSVDNIIEHLNLRTIEL